MRDCPDAALIYAAGFGTRMGAMTRDRPKPLIEVAGRALIDHALALTEGISRRVVNTHYHADQMATHLAGRGVEISQEDPVLETGGGLKAALPMLGHGPVITLNSDAVWTGENPVDQLMAAWDHDRMDALLLLATPEYAVGHQGIGDFTRDEAGRLSKGGPLIFTGAQIIRTELLAGIVEAAFSIWPIWTRMLAEGRAFGVLHRGRWADVGRPEGIALAEAMLAADNDV